MNSKMSMITMDGTVYQHISLVTGQKEITCTVCGTVALDHPNLFLVHVDKVNPREFLSIPLSCACIKSLNQCLMRKLLTEHCHLYNEELLPSSKDFERSPHPKEDKGIHHLLSKYQHLMDLKVVCHGFNQQSYFMRDTDADVARELKEVADKIHSMIK